MRFRCEQCGTDYSLPDEAVARATRARCPRCKHSQVLHSAAGVPLTTPPEGKSQIGRVSITTLTVTPEQEPEPEEELFGELEWESDSQLDFVVGRSHVEFDDIPLAPPKIPPVNLPVVPAPRPLQPSSLAPPQLNEVQSGPPASVDGYPPEPHPAQTDAWPEDEVSDPWRRTPLPPLQQPLSPVRPPAPPLDRQESPPGRAPAAAGPAPPAAVSPGTSGNRRPTPVPGSPLSTPPGAVPGSTPPRPTGSTAAVTPAPAPSLEPCAACGAKLVDADDLASGVCGACRARTAAALGRGPTASARGVTPLPPTPIPIDLETVDVAPRTPTPPARPRRQFRAMPEPERRGRVWMLLGLLGVAAAVSAALWYLRVRPDPADLKAVAEAIPRPRKKSLAQAKLPEGLLTRLGAWKAPTEPRPVPELLDSAQTGLAQDTEASELAAEQTLQLALLQEPRNAEALGLWLEAIARGRGQQLAASELAALIRLGESALEEVGRRPPLQVGLASLLLVRGTGPDVERARTLGQAAVDASAPPPPPATGAGTSPSPPAPPAWWGTRARLLLAEAYATSSAALALSLLQEVQQRDPAQRRVFNVRAAAHEAAGSPRVAAADLQARLALDPDEPRTALALARLFGQVGETAQARRIYDRLQANPVTQDGPAVIDMAVLRAGPEHAPAEGMKLLSRAIGRGRLSGTDLLRAQVTLARLARAAGDSAVASQAVAAALSAAPDDVQAHVQGLLVDLDRGVPEQAAAHLPPVLDHLADAGLAGLLEGRVRAAQQRWQSAAEAFDRSAGADARRTDARLWAGAAWAMTGARDRALHSAGPALQADPYREGPGFPPLWPGDGLKGAAERLMLLSKEDRDSQPLLAEAVLRMHQGDAAGAEALVDRILKAGGTQPVVLAWKSLLLGARGDTAGALARGREAAAAGGRSSGFAQFALGSALLATGDVEGAQRALRDALTHSPGLLAAQVRLAEAEARTGGIVSARERLQRVIVLDPEYASARRALYLLPPEG